MNTHLQLTLRLSPGAVPPLLHTHTLAQGRFTFSGLFVVINNHFSGIKSLIYLIRIVTYHCMIRVTEMMMSVDPSFVVW